MLLQAVILLLLRCLASSLGQYDLCKSLVSTDDGSVWEHYACQPSPAPMKDYMRIKVDPPGITCGNPPERFCTLINCKGVILAGIGLFVFGHLEANNWFSIGETTLVLSETFPLTSLKREDRQE